MLDFLLYQFIQASMQSEEADIFPSLRPRLVALLGWLS